MPIHYRFVERWGIVVTTVEGEVTAEDLAQHAEALAKDPRARSSDELADLTHVTGGPAPTEAVRRMGEQLRETDTNRRGGKFALVAPADAAFGMARLYQVHREHADIQIRVFRGLEDALRWLGIEELD